MQTHFLFDVLEGYQPFEQIAEESRRDGAVIAASGLAGAQKAHLACALAARTGRPLVFLCDSERSAAQTMEDVSALMGGGVSLFPAREITFYQDVAASREVAYRRIEAMRKLVSGEDGKVHIRAGASCIGQGLGTVLVQLVVTNAKLTRDQVVYDGNSTFITPDSGDTSGSRQTLITGEACRRACLLLRDAMENRSLSDLSGQEFYGEYYAKTNPLGADVPNPVSHVAYGYATQMCILDKETGFIKKMVAAHDVGKAINPLSCEGQIEGGVVMSMGYALTEQYPLDHGKPTAKYGTLGLFRSHQIPEIKAIVIDKPGLNLANGAIGIGEITSIPTAPAIAQAYYRYDGERRRSLPLDHTPYKK